MGGFPDSVEARIELEESHPYVALQPWTERKEPLFALIEIPLGQREDRYSVLAAAIIALSLFSVEPRF